MRMNGVASVMTYTPERSACICSLARSATLPPWLWAMTIWRVAGAPSICRSSALASLAAREAERLCGLQIDRQAEARWLLKGQVRRLRSFENAINKGCHTLEALVLIRSIGHQATVTNEEIELFRSHPGRTL